MERRAGPWFVQTVDGVWSRLAASLNDPPTRFLCGQPRLKPNQPSIQPSNHLSIHPTTRPTDQPANQISIHPSTHPPTQPIDQPTNQPSIHPSSRPTKQPTKQPANQPTSQPTNQPASQPTNQPKRKGRVKERQPKVRETEEPLPGRVLPVTSKFIWYTSGCPCRRLAFEGQCLDWSVWCQCTVGR